MNKNTWLKLLPVGLLVLAAPVLGQGGAGPASTATPAARPPADAPPAATASAAQEQPIRGITRCNSDLALGFPLNGRIGKLHVSEGSVVKPGQPLASLENVAEALEVERRLVQWKNTAELSAAQARLKTASEQAAAAREVYSSTQGISREELQNRELAQELALNEVARLKAAKEMERLDYLTSRENLERRSLRAPVPGIVTKLLHHAGESVQANEPAMRLCDLSKILFVVNVPTARIERLKAGDRVRLAVNGESANVQGKVLFVSPVVDAASGLREVKIELLPGRLPVRAGQTARLLLEGAQ